MKRCTKCLEEKPLELFGKHKATKDGLNWWCRACNVRNSSSHYHAHKGPNKRDLKRAYYLAHKTEIDAARKANVAVVHKAWRERNREKLRNMRREWSAQHPEHNAKMKAQYRAANLEVVRVRQMEATRKDRAKHPEKWRARWSVSSAVARGRLARVRTLPCVDCGSQASRYDHYLGYAPEHRLDVQPVCSKCDGLREKARGHRRIYA